MGVYDNERITDPEKIVAGFGADEMSDASFFDDRIIDLAVACNRNKKNNHIIIIAVWLGLSMTSAVLGIFIHGVATLIETGWLGGG
jgi:hypothetical protein